jgi:hypothetical protein
MNVLVQAIASTRIDSFFYSCSFSPLPLLAAVSPCLPSQGEEIQLLRPRVLLRLVRLLNLHLIALSTHTREALPTWCSGRMQLDDRVDVDRDVEVREGTGFKGVAAGGAGSAVGGVERGGGIFEFTSTNDAVEDEDTDGDASDEVEVAMQQGKCQKTKEEEKKERNRDGLHGQIDGLNGDRAVHRGIRARSDEEGNAGEPSCERGRIRRRSR